MIFNYYTLFKNYNAEQFEHSVFLQIDRLKRWGFSVKGKHCLDVGCGGGRTIVALQKLGAQKVVGVEIDENLADLASERTKTKIYKASALALPLNNESFDTVICSGVLHHTNDMAQGVREIQRVLKKGGQVYFLFYYNHPVWIKTNIMRFICTFIPFSVMNHFLFFIPANKRYLMDNWYVKYMHISTQEEIKDLMKIFSEWKVVREPPAHNIRIIATK